MSPQTECLVNSVHSNGTVAIDHPLIKHHLSRLRNMSTPAEEFRLLVQRLAVLLAYEATKDLDTIHQIVQSPLAPAKGHSICDSIALIPILRAGLGMVEPVLNLIPQAAVWHLGIYRDETTSRPVKYYSRLPDDQPADVALVLDPMLATGGSAVEAISALRNWGVSTVKLLSIIASQHGISEVESHFPNTQVFVCAIDPELNSQNFIVPGLGDAGDRMFNTLPRD